jgi:hypothetical protein
MEAQARLFAVLKENTKEGVPMARLYNLELQREISPTFSVYASITCIVNKKAFLGQ